MSLLPLEPFSRCRAASLACLAWVLLSCGNPSGGEHHIDIMTTLADGTEDEVGESELPLSSDCVWASPSELNIAGSHPVAYTTVHNGCSGSVCFKCFKTAGTFGVTVSMGLIGTFSMYGAGAPHEHDLIYPVCLDQDGKLSLGFDVSKSQEPKGWFALWPCGVDSPVLVTGTYVRP